MTHALILTFDDAGQDAFRAIFAALDRAGIPSLGSLGWPPHVTLAIGEGLDRVDFGRLGTPPPSGLAFDAIATFGATPTVLFATVRPTHELLALHEAVHHYLVGIPIVHNRFYLPGAWMPHATLSERLAPGDLDACIEALGWHFPITVERSALALADVHTGATRPLSR